MMSTLAIRSFRREKNSFDYSLKFTLLKLIWLLTQIHLIHFTQIHKQMMYVYNWMVYFRYSGAASRRLADKARQAVSRVNSLKPIIHS